MIAVIALAVAILTVVPLCLFADLIGRLPHPTRVRPAWYLCLVASWLGGVPVAYAGLLFGLNYLSRSHELSDWVFYPLLFLTGPVGGSIGPGLIYLHLRLRRTDDPDYGPLGPDALG